MRERLHSNRTTCLHTRNGKDFKNLHDILRGALREGKAGLLLFRLSPPFPSPFDPVAPHLGARACLSSNVMCAIFMRGIVLVPC